MTINCIQALRKLRKNSKFTDLSYKQMLYEILRNNGWSREELIYLIDELIKDKNYIEKVEQLFEKTYSNNKNL